MLWMDSSLSSLPLSRHYLQRLARRRRVETLQHCPAFPQLRLLDLSSAATGTLAGGFSRPSSAQPAAQAAAQQVAGGVDSAVGGGVMQCCFAGLNSS